ncbi:MAG: hypothetical protein JXC32_11220 [Anaerolineae bacterium]|nr:hypothetical protein [Anaerolineae bacterium]
MSDNMTPFEEVEQQPSATGTPPAPEEGQDAGRDWERGRRRWRSPGSWLGGAILIILGLIFLAENLGMSIPILDNWWALFILIPAVGALNNARQEYERNGRRFNSSVSGSLMGGLAMVLVTLTFLFSWPWGVIWPVFLILAGLTALAMGIFGR